MSLLRTWVAVAAVAGLMTEGALAADMAVKAVKAPPQAPVGYDWAGFYIGGHAGYSFGIDQSSYPFQNDVLGSHGFTGGVLGGYNYMLAPRVLIGIEGDVSWTNNAHTDTITESPFTETLKISQGPAYAVRGRAGYLVTPETLLYGAAGWSWSNYRLSQEGNTGGNGSVSGNVNGVQAGGGIETKLDAHFSARVEYLVTLYNTFALANTPLTIKPSTSVGRAALVYNFGGGAPAPAFAPEPAPMPTWNGFYLGAELGVGITNAKVGAAGGNSALTMDGFAFPAVGPTALIGYDWRIAPRWVIGAEGEIAPGFSTNEFKLEFVSAVRGKLGYLLTPSTMVYGTLGWTAAGIRSSTLNNSPVTIAAQRVDGIEGGGGIETAITNHWLARFEYHYAAMSTLNNVAVTVGNLGTGIVSAKPTYQNMHLGVSYLFDGP